ncbi:META domain-containing protein [Chitinophaga sp.]|uniref:META domain-containing protein n=1 Tax=Chitinophaga sp. TaxID=1869181 RepID=UPI002F94D9CD
MLFALAITLATTFTGPVQNKQQPAKTQVIYVKESKEPCTGVAPMECLQIKGVNDTDWSNLYTNISGFKYTPGYRYKLRVRITQIKNPPADGSSLKYTLTKVLEKKKIRNAGLSAATGKKWVLVKMDNEAITDGAIWMEFDPAQKRIHGKSGCNSMMGAYTLSGNSITFSKTAGTLMACPDRDMMRRETTFMKQLGDQTFQYTISGQTVSLLQNGNAILQFRLEEKNGNASGNTGNNNWASVSNKKWTLKMMNEGVISNSGIWLQFDAAKKRFSGKGGCNNISGGYTIAGNKITFSQAMSTRMMCGDADVMRRESDFLKQLGGHTFTYAVNGETIDLQENGKPVMQFILESSSNEEQGAASNDKQWAFIGSKKWSVIKLNDVTLDNSGIWLEFDTHQKRFHGKGGCNSISGGYSTNGDEIKFTKGISTRMACIDADVMRRETEFLKLIGDNSFRYDVADQTLNLYKDGKIVVMFGMQDKTL